MTPRPHTVLEARGLRCQRGHRWIVDGVDLVIHAGEIVGLLGPNGAGKTVTLSMLIGLVPPTAGHVLLNGASITDLPFYQRARRGLGYLPQERSVFRRMTARDNVRTVMESHGIGRTEAARRTAKLLAEFALTDVADVHAERLSGGEQRRLEVARALASEPRVLLFDEPFTGIDPLTIEVLHRILVGLRARGVSVVLTDHNVFEALSLCDRAYVLVDGRVLASGTPAELTVHPGVREHFLGQTFGEVPVDRSAKP